MDVMRADLLTLAEQGDYGRVKLIIEEVLGRKFHGLSPMHASYIPTTCPVDRMPSSGYYEKRKPWTDGLLAAYPPGYYLAIGENIVTTPTAAQLWGRAALRPDEWFDASALTMCEWRNASGLQPAPACAEFPLPCGYDGFLAEAPLSWHQLLRRRRLLRSLVVVVVGVVLLPGRCRRRSCGW